MKRIGNYVRQDGQRLALRRDVPACTPEPMKLLDLPDEVLVEIMGKLKKSDICNARYTHRRLAAAGLSALAERMHRIYVDISTASLRRFAEICASRANAARIKHVKIALGLLCHARQYVESHNSYQLQRQWGVNLGIPGTPSLSNEVMNLYEQHKAAQSRLLESHAFRDTMVRGLGSLTKLEEITIQHGPGEERIRPHPEIYNWDRRWDTNRFHGMYGRDEGNALHMNLKGMLWTAAAFECGPALHANAALVFAALAPAIEKRPNGTLKIHFPSASVRLLDSAWTTYMSHHPSARGALSKISNLACSFQHEDRLPELNDIHHRLPEVNDMDVPDVNHQLSQESISAWLALCRYSSNLTTLLLSGRDCTGDKLIACLIRRLAFPALAKFELSLSQPWFEGREPRDGYRDNLPPLKSTELTGFLARHSDNLTSLRLFSASGVDESGNHNSSLLRSFVRRFKLRFPRLTEVVVAEWQLLTDPIQSWDEKDDRDYIGEIEDYRQEATSSPLGQLARECDVRAAELFIGYLPNRPVHEPSCDHFEDQPAAGMHLVNVFFVYDFGPFILRESGIEAPNQRNYKLYPRFALIFDTAQDD